MFPTIHNPRIASLPGSNFVKRKWFRLRGESHDISLKEDLSLKVYADSRPHNLEVSRLQKGLVLTLNQKELIEEGIGFGVPVAILSDKTYFSGSSQVKIKRNDQDTIIRKQFYMDTISKKGWKDGVFVDNPLYKLFTGSLATSYRNYPASRRVIFPLIKLRSSIGIKTLFTKAQPRGKVDVTYTIKPDGVHVKADFTALNKRGCEKVLLLNEQRSTFFRKFFDSDGLDLTNEKIGAWDLIKADWGCFSDLGNNLSFCLKSTPFSRLFRGREHIAGRLAWAGMGYELSPSQRSFEYELQICAGKAQGCR